MSKVYTVEAIKALPQDQPVVFEGVFLARKVDTKTARNGSPFLSVEFGDNTGAFTANCFSDTLVFRTLSESGAGHIFRVNAQTDYYQERLSPKISRLTRLSEVEAEPFLETVVQSSPESSDSLWADLEAGIQAIEHDGLRRTVENALEEHGGHFRTSTAALSMHHAYRNGLLEHTVHMVRNARALLPLYPEVNPSLCLAGIILHDIGKIVEYAQSLASEKTRSGVLQGHVVLGYRIARKAALQSRLNADLTERLEHIVLSHQGELAWGAAAMAATPEAVFVSMVDNLDAKMGMVQQALRETPEEKQFSDYIAGLQTKLLVTPPDVD
ncbi:MAG: 3'-5' exoribonuclease YhaM family protein [Opitutales bacterium]